VTSETSRARDARPTVVGTVVSAKMKDTITVREERTVPHPLYGKYVRRATKYYAHDAGNTAHEGDTVEIAHTRPLSKLKNWRLVRIVRRGPGGIVHSDADASGGGEPAAGEA
jgi:small subunit ribosomal protein S17